VPLGRLEAALRKHEQFGVAADAGSLTAMQSSGILSIEFERSLTRTSSVI